MAKAIKLAEYIRRHGIDAWTDGGKLFALDTHGEQLDGGEWGWITEPVELPVSWQKVRDWLGY